MNDHVKTRFHSSPLPACRCAVGCSQRHLRARSSKSKELSLPGSAVFQINDHLHEQLDVDQNHQASKELYERRNVFLLTSVLEDNWKTDPFS